MCAGPFSFFFFLRGGVVVAPAEIDVNGLVYLLHKPVCIRCFGHLEWRVDVVRDIECEEQFFRRHNVDVAEQGRVEGVLYCLRHALAALAFAVAHGDKDRTSFEQTGVNISQDGVYGRKKKKKPRYTCFNKISIV